METAVAKRTMNNDPDIRSAYSREYYRKNKQSLLAKRFLDRQAHPEKRRAIETSFENRQRKKLLYAIKRGKLIRKHICQDCGSDVRVQAHHEDYSKPLDVDWLCPPCHGKRHRGDKSPSRKRKATPPEHKRPHRPLTTEIKKLPEHFTDYKLRTWNIGQLARYSRRNKFSTVRITGWKGEPIGEFSIYRTWCAVEYIDGEPLIKETKLWGVPFRNLEPITA